MKQVLTAPELSQGAKVLWMHIMQKRGRGIGVTESQGVLAQEIGSTFQSVNGYIKLLKEAGWLEVAETPGTRQLTYTPKIPA